MLALTCVLAVLGRKVRRTRASSTTPSSCAGRSLPSTLRSRVGRARGGVEPPARAQEQATSPGAGPRGDAGRALERLQIAVQNALSEQTRRVLGTLTPREEKVLRMRFGIGEKSDHTLEEVGQDFSVTRERIRQIEAKALSKLRHPSRTKRLRAFVE